MPKQQSPKLSIRLDLLRPQSSPEPIITKLLRWLLSTGRFIFVFVEALVLIVFIARFKLDEDLVNKKDAIEKQIPYIESLKHFEIEVRETQLKLSTIASFRRNIADYPQILKAIASQTPAGVKISSIKLEKNPSYVNASLSGTALTNNDLSSFIAGLKQDPLFSDVNITSFSLDKNILNFSVKIQAKPFLAGVKI